MEFINRISYPLFFVKSAVARAPRWVAVCALLAAAAGLARFNSRPVQAKQGTLRRGKAGVERLKTVGGHASLAQAPLVDDAQASYPQTIDPLLTQRQKLTAVDGAENDHFGRAVAFSGNTLIIGAPLKDVIGEDQGSVYVFTRSGAAWTLQQKLTAQDGAAKSEFGFSVAISGDTVVIGAPLDDTGGNGDQGSAYVFTRSGAVWTQQQKLTAQDGAANDFFGFSVAISGETVAVSAFGDDIGANENQGSAYVFTRSDTTWTQQQKLIANDGEAGHFFGRSVAISGDTVVVGAPDDDIGANFGQGSAYVFTRSGAVWTLQQKLTSDDGEAIDLFGSAVALSGDTLAVGAELDNIDGNVGNPGQGSAYVFARTGTVWTQRQKLIADDGQAVDSFGFAVALSGNAVVVGAPMDDINANRDQGSAYVFVLSDCDFSVEPINHAFPSQGGNGMVSVIATDGCAWTAASNDPMITITSGANGSGDGAVRFAVAQNPNTGSRRGTLTVAGHKVTVVQAAPVVCVSAASFVGSPLAIESIVAAFGNGLATATEVATTLPLPTTLGGTRVSVLDSLGTERFAPLFFVSPTQINFQVPPGAAVGKTLVTIIHDGETVAAESPQIEMVSPALFSADASGQGLLTGLALRAKADGSQSFEPTVRFDEENHRFVAAPIDLGPATDQVFLVLFATGVRNRSSLGAVSVKIGGVIANALYAGPQGSFVGLDQLNILLPRSLAGRGEVELSVLVDGQEANKLKAAIK